MKMWKRSLRYFYLRTVRMKSTSDELAKGFAVGVFWGMFPLPGLQMAVAILFAVLLRCSKIAAAAGTWLTNPITSLPVTALNFHVGQSVLGRSWAGLPQVNFSSVENILAIGSDVIVSYLIGCLVVGTIAAIMSYFLGVPLINYLRRRATHHRAKHHRVYRH